MSINPINKIVIFDFDGVLADTLQDMLQFSDEVTAGMGINYQTTLEDLEALQPMSFANLGRRIGFLENEVPIYVQNMIAHFESSPSPSPIFPGMANVVTHLAQSSILAIVSGNTRKVIERFLISNSLLNAFQSIYGVDQPGNKAEKIQKILTEINQPNLPALVIGDAVSDIEAAHQVGVLGIAVGWGHQPGSKLMRAKPDYFVSTPRELLEAILSVTSDK